MKKRFVIGIGILCFVPIVLMLGRLCFGLFYRPQPYTVFHPGTPPPRNLVIQTIASDILVEQGSSFQLEYLLSGKERVGSISFDNKGDDFIFSVKGKLFGIRTYGRHYVRITVPEDLIFSSISLKTVSGRIVWHTETPVSFQNGRFETVSGDSLFNPITFQSASFHSISGKITAHIQSFETCFAKTVSGTIDLKTQQITSVEAKSFGKISVFGSDFHRQASVTLSDSPEITAESVSGRIFIESY